MKEFSDCLKCCLISMGMGFVIGAVVTVNNKKAASAVKEAQNVALEKLEMAKDGLAKVKEKVEEGIEKAQEQPTQNSKPQNKSKTSK